MNELTKREQLDIATVDNDLYSALKNSVFPGAKDESIFMVLSYCKARGLDPLQKPVHIVPMWIVDAKTKEGAQRDVVMPGIGLYRIQAQRSGQYAGQTDPEFGEDTTESLGGVSITFPKWCKITVKKQMSNGVIVEFSAKEFWKENYATQKKDSAAPNAMWKKRPYAQLAKCCEAQALRKAFPDILDQSPTAEEMEGKHFEQDVEVSKAEALNKKLGLTKDKSHTYEGEVINEQTGEVTAPADQSPTPPPSNAPTLSFEEAKAKLELAENLDDLTATASIVNDLGLPKEKTDELRKIYRTKHAEIKGKENE